MVTHEDSWRLMEPNLGSWSLIEAHGDSRRLMESNWGSWSLIEACGDSWWLMKTLRDSWSLIEPPRDTWRLLATHGGSWRLIETHGESWRLIEAEVKRVFLLLIDWTRSGSRLAHYNIRWTRSPPKHYAKIRRNASLRKCQGPAWSAFSFGW